MSNARHAVLSAIIDRLAADAVLMAMLGDGRILDRPPRGAALPLATFGRMTTTGDVSDGQGLETHSLDIDVFGRGTRGEVSAICDTIAAHLDEAELLPDGFRLIWFRHLATTITPSRDLRSFRGRSRFRFMTERLD